MVSQKKRKRKEKTKGENALKHMLKEKMTKEKKRICIYCTNREIQTEMDRSF